MTGPPFFASRGRACLGPPVTTGITRGQYLEKVLETQTGSSGQTCNDLFQVMQELRPPFVLWENVPEIVEGSNGSNISWFVTRSRGIGYEVAFRVLISSDFLMPQARRRTFGICADVEQANLTSKDTHLMVESMMQLVESIGRNCRDKMLPLDGFLLKPNDKYLLAELARLESVKEKGLEDSQQTTWRPALLDLCRKAGVDLDTVALPAELEDSKGIRSLCKRQRRRRHGNARCLQ